MVAFRHVRAVVLALAAGSSGCGLVEDFDGYSDRFDAGGPPSGDTSIGDGSDDDTGTDDTSAPKDTTPGIDTLIEDVPVGTDTSCAAGSKYCGGSCIPVTSDPLNCGGCGVVCEATKGPLSVCTGGVCTCPVGTDDCGVCTHKDRDPLNCGTCGTPVVDGAHWCVGGVGTCRPGTSVCKEYDTAGTPSYHVDCTNSASCTDTSSDGSHCTLSTTSVMRCYGSPSPSRCIHGGCTLSSCPSGHKACPSTITGSESCWDIKHDSNNCGDCNVKCAAAEVCSDGKCVPYRPAKSCSECVGVLSQCCTAWSIPVCVAAGASCPVTPGS